MSKKNERNHFTDPRRDGGIPSVPTFPRKDQLAPTDNNLRRAADSIKNDLIRNGGDRRIRAIAPIGIAIGVLGYYAGPTGTQELFEMPFGTRSFENYVANETIAYYARNKEELRRSLQAGGVLSQQDVKILDAQARRGNIQGVQTFILTKLGQAHEEILQRPNPRENLLVQTFSHLPQDAAERVEENAGQLVAMCYIDAARKGIQILSSTDLTAQEVRSDSVLYRIRTSLTEPPNTLTIPVTSPQTLFVGGPGTSTATGLSSFLRFQHSVYADRSGFVASLIRSMAIYGDRRVGDTIDNGDVVTRSHGMEKAAEEFAGQIDIAQFAMVHSAPREIVRQTLNAFGKGMKRGASIISVLPDKVYSSETSFQAFSEEAEVAGLVRVPFIIDGREIVEYNYAHPNSTPGKEIPDRRVFIGVFKMP